jgi:hypothetical protein
MNWPQIAACLRSRMREVSKEAQGAMHGQYWERPGAPMYGFHATTERGGTKLVLTVEVGDFDELDAKVGEAVRRGLPDVSLVGRIVMLKQVVDVIGATATKIDAAARGLVARAEKLRQGTVPTAR